MGIVWVMLLMVLIDPGWPPLKQGLAIFGQIAAFCLYILTAHKIFRHFGSMFAERQKRGGYPG